MVKWIFLVIIIAIGFMIYTGNMGGAKDAAQNYVDVRHSQTIEGQEARPNVLHSLIKDNPFKEKKEQ